MYNNYPQLVLFWVFIYLFFLEIPAWADPEIFPWLGPRENNFIVFAGAYLVYLLFEIKKKI